jgi:inorganic pyrophosphatase
MKSHPYKLHPWHGVIPFTNLEDEFISYIEITPTDTVKYEVDKKSGYLKIDRPQLYSNVLPALYGFIPKTYCAEKVAQLCMEVTGLKDVKGDGDPLDICVLTERTIERGDILVNSIPIGGFRMIDNNEADDKIIAVLKNDHIYGKIRNIDELPVMIVDRLFHYFTTYKMHPEKKSPIQIAEKYNSKKAIEVIKASFEDYNTHYGNIYGE